MDQPTDSAAWLRDWAKVARRDYCTGIATRLDAIAAELERTRRERDEAREALQPFAEAYRIAKRVGRRDILTNSWASEGRLGLDDFARAAEIVAPEEKA